MAMLNNQIVHPPKYGKASGKGQKNALHLQNIQQQKQAFNGANQPQRRKKLSLPLRSTCLLFEKWRNHDKPIQLFGSW